MVDVLGAFSAVPTVVSCLLAPVIILSSIMLVVSWFVAVKEALDLDWSRTIATVVLGWIALVLIMLVAGLVRGLLGMTTAGFKDLLG